MHAATTTLPEITSVEQARGVVTSLFHDLQQARWRVEQLEKQLFGPSSERKALENLSKEQVLLSLFPAAAQPATQDVVLPASSEATEKRARRQPAAKVLETVTERIEPKEKVCPHCGQEKCEISHEKSERFEYVPARIVRHEIIRPKLACPCGQSGVTIAPMPPNVIAHGQPGPALVAHGLLTKLMDHVQLHWHNQPHSRMGRNLPKITVGD